MRMLVVSDIYQNYQNDTFTYQLADFGGDGGCIGGVEGLRPQYIDY
jgi:hypothetical protein